MNKRDFLFNAIILMLSFFIWKGCQDSNSFEQLYHASADTLHQTRNEFSQQVSITSLHYGTINDFKRLHTADSSALWKLQKIIDKLTISASYVSTVTGNSISSVTQSITIHDTITKDGIKYVFPDYIDTINNKWEHFIITANRDSFKLQYKVFNEFNLKQSWQRNGLFKRKTPIAEITNLNPNTVTLEYKTFTVKENKGNRLRDGLIGIAIGAVLVEMVNVFKIRIPITIK